MGEGRGIYSVAMFHVGAKSALLRRLFLQKRRHPPALLCLPFKCGAKMMLNAEAAVDSIMALQLDAVFAAIGSDRLMLPIASQICEFSVQRFYCYLLSEIPMTTVSLSKGPPCPERDASELPKRKKRSLQNWNSTVTGLSTPPMPRRTNLYDYALPESFSYTKRGTSAESICCPNLFMTLH